MSEHTGSAPERPAGDGWQQKLAECMEAYGHGDQVEPLEAAIAAEAKQREAYRKKAKRKRGSPRPPGVTDAQADAFIERRKDAHQQLTTPLAPVSIAGIELAPDDPKSTRGPGGGESASTARRMKRALRWKPRPGKNVPLPFEAARRAKRATSTRRRQFRELERFSQEQRLMLWAAARRGPSSWRADTHRTARRTITFALMLHMASSSVDKRGFCRELFGISREGLAAALGAQEDTKRPVHANTISAMLRSLEAVGLLVTQQANGVSDPRVLEGPTGWTFNIYRWRPRVAVDPALLFARGRLQPDDAPPSFAELLEMAAAEYDVRGGLSPPVPA